MHSVDRAMPSAAPASLFLRAASSSAFHPSQLRCFALTSTAILIVWCRASDDDREITASPVLHLARDPIDEPVGSSVSPAASATGRSADTAASSKTSPLMAVFSMV